MSEKVLLTVKTDKKLKKEAQKVAKGMGLPLGAVVNAQLRRFVQEQSVMFELLPTPNTKTKKKLARRLKDVRQGKNVVGPFRSAKEAVAFLEQA